MHVLFWRDTPFDATEMALVDKRQRLWRLDVVRASVKRARTQDWCAKTLQPRQRGALRDGAVLVSLRSEPSDEPLPSEDCIIATHPMVVFTREDERLDVALARLSLVESSTNYRTRSSDDFSPVIAARRDAAGKLLPLTRAWWLETFNCEAPTLSLRTEHSPREVAFWIDALSSENFDMDQIEIPCEQRFDALVNHDGWDYAYKHFFRGYHFTKHFSAYSQVVPSDVTYTGPCFFCGKTKELHARLLADEELWIGSTCLRQFNLVLRYFDFLAEIWLVHEELEVATVGLEQAAERLAAHYRILDEIQL